MNELSTLNDPDVLGIIGTHSDEFFKAMKEFEPYTLVHTSANRLEIELKSSYLDLNKLEATFKHLDCLGYHSEAHLGTYTMPNGEQTITITIDWKDYNGNKETVSIPT